MELFHKIDQHLFTRVSSSRSCLIHPSLSLSLPPTLVLFFVLIFTLHISHTRICIFCHLPLFFLSHFFSSLPCAHLGIGRRQGQCTFCVQETGTVYYLTERMMGTVLHTIKSRTTEAERQDFKLSSFIIVMLV